MFRYAYSCSIVLVKSPGELACCPSTSTQVSTTTSFSACPLHGYHVVICLSQGPTHSSRHGRLTIAHSTPSAFVSVFTDKDRQTGSKTDSFLDQRYLKVTWRRPG